MIELIFLRVSFVIFTSLTALFFSLWRSEVTMHKITKKVLAMIKEGREISDT